MAISREEIDNITKAAKALENYTKSLKENNAELKKHEKFANDINKLSETYQEIVEESDKKEKSAHREVLKTNAKLLRFERDHTKNAKKRKSLTNALSKAQKGLTAEERKEVALMRTSFSYKGKEYKEHLRKLKAEQKGVKEIHAVNKQNADERKKLFSNKNLGKFKEAFSMALDKGDIRKAMSSYRMVMRKESLLQGKANRIQREEAADDMRLELFKSMSKLDLGKSLFGNFEEAEKKAMTQLAKDYEKATTIDEKVAIARQAQVIEKVTELEIKKAKEIEEAKLEVATQIASTPKGSKGLETLTGMGSSAAGGIKGFFKGDQAGVQKSAVQTGAWAKQAKEAGGSLKFLGGGLEALSKGLGMLGKLNWVFALLGAVKALISAVNELDKFMKALNQTFLELAGPSVGIGNVRDEMRKFNREIFNIGRNFHLGLKVEEVQSMFKAMGGAGMSLQGVMQKIGSYGKAIESARAMSLQFGVSFDKMGGDMTSQMIDLNSSLDDVAKNFNKLAFDAAKAGISSDKFYQTVESTAMSLSYYGNNVKYVSGLLGDFYKTGNLAFKDAAKVTGTFATAFENMDENARRKFITLAGSDAMAKYFEKAIVDAENKIKSLEEEEEAIKDPSRKKEIQAQINTTEALIRQLQKAKGSSLGEQQVALPYLTKYIMPMLMESLKNVGTGPTGEKISLTTLARDILPGLDQNQVFKGIIQQADIAAITYEKLNASLVDNIKNNENYGSQVIDLTKQYAEGKVTFSDIKYKLAGLMKAAKPKAKEEDISNLLDATENNPSVILKGLKGDMNDLVNDFISYMGTLNKGEAKISEKNLRELVGSITPLEKYADITKDYLKFQMGDKLLSGILAATSSAASSLGYLVEGDKEAKEAVKRDEKAKENFVTGDKPQEIVKLVEKMMGMEKEGTDKDERGEFTPEYELLMNSMKKYEADRVTGGLASSYSTNVRAEKTAMERYWKEKGDLRKRLEGAITDIEKKSIQDELSKLDKQSQEIYGSATKALKESVIIPGDVTEGKDVKALSGGWKKLSKGDIVVHDKELSKTIDSRYGGFADRVAGSMKPLAAPASGTARINQNNWGGVNINFNAPADASNPAAYRNMFVDAVEQIFDRKMYAEKSKGKGR